MLTAVGQVAVPLQVAAPAAVAAGLRVATGLLAYPLLLGLPHTGGLQMHLLHDYHLLVPNHHALRFAADQGGYVPAFQSIAVPAGHHLRHTWIEVCRCSHFVHGAATPSHYVHHSIHSEYRYVQVAMGVYYAGLAQTSLDAPPLDPGFPNSVMSQ